MDLITQINEILQTIDDTPTLWKSLSPLQCKFVCNPVMLNTEEFMVGQDKRWQIESQALWKYNIRTNIWELLAKYPDEYKPGDHTACSDIKNNNFYLVGGNYNQVLHFDLKWHFISVSTALLNVGPHPSLLCYDNTLSVFGGRWSKHHNTWDAVSEEFTEIKKIDGWKTGNTCNGSVYVKSQNCLFVFGGYDCGDKDRRLNGIWRFDLGGQKNWIQVKTVLPHKMDSFGWILTNDDKYIIIFGGSCNKKEDGKDLWSGDIFIWNVDTMVISKSDIYCPECGLFNAIIMPNDDIHLHRVYDGMGHWKINVKDIIVDEELIVNGYMRFLVDLDVPVDICDIIHFYYIRITNIAEH